MAVRLSTFRILPGGVGGPLCLSACVLTLFMGAVLADVPQRRAAEEDSALPLPRWSDEEIRAFRENLAGSSGALLPATGDMSGAANDLITTPLPFGPRLDQTSVEANSEIMPRLRAEDMRLFLPESLLLAPPAPSQTRTAIQPTSLAALKDVTPEFLASAAQALAQEYLIDPGTLVHEVQQQELSRFLDFHAHEALIDLHVLILPADRKLPADANLDAVCSGSLAQGSACLLVYPLGEPWRARLFLSKTVHDHASAEFLKETARTCVEEALHSSDVQDQLRNYTVELSTRLFWLQKAIGTTLKPAAGTGQPLAEVAGDTGGVVPVSQPGFPLLAGGIAAGVMALGALSRPVLHRWREWRRLQAQNRVWLLPELETVPRLGGAFAGGTGAMLRYSKAANA